MNRALRAATMGVLLLAPIPLAACSAGQVTQTATQDRDKSGAMAEAGDLTLRSVLLAYPREGRYERGDDAELQAAIVNGGNEDDTLVDISGDGFESVRVRDTGSRAAAAAETSPAPAAQAGEVSLPIPARSTTFIGGDDGATVILEGLTEELTPAQRIEVTLTFERAGEITLPLLVGNPSRALPRDDAFDFHEEEGEEAHQADNEVSGGGSGEDTSGGDGHG